MMYNGNLNRQRNNYDRNSHPRNNSETNLADNPKLKNVDPLKLKIIMEIKAKSKNRSMEELLPEIMKIIEKVRF